jgi:hypothetical protein
MTRRSARSMTSSHVDRFHPLGRPPRSELPIEIPAHRALVLRLDVPWGPGGWHALVRMRSRGRGRCHPDAR